MCLFIGGQLTGVTSHFPCAKTGMAFLLEGNVVMMPYLCSRASSTRMSSLRLIGAGRLWLWAGLLSKGVSCTLNSVLIPKLKRCRAKVSLNSTSRASRAFLASGSKMGSVQSKLVGIGFGSWCELLGFCVLIFLITVIDWEYVFEWAYVPSHCLTLVVLETFRFCSLHRFSMFSRGNFCNE